MILLLVPLAFLIFYSTEKGTNIVGEATKEISFFKYDKLFKNAGAKYGLPWKWLKAIAMNESSLGTNPRVLAGLVSSDGKSWGLMQLTLPTARDYMPSASIEDLKNDAVSIDLAAQFLDHLYDRFGGDMRKVVMSYNQGEGNTSKGKEYAAEYFERFSKHLQQINERQGD